MKFAISLNTTTCVNFSVRRWFATAAPVWPPLVVGDTVFPLYKGFKIDFLMLLSYAKTHCPSPFPNGIFKRHFSINSHFLSPNVHTFIGLGQMGLLCMWSSFILSLNYFNLFSPCACSPLSCLAVSLNTLPLKEKMEFSICSSCKMLDFVFKMAKWHNTNVVQHLCYLKER